MKVVALFRVSTERQANEGASLDAQQRRYRHLAEAKGWTTVAEFKGVESATQAATERHVLQRVLAVIREEQVDAIWVFEQSRLMRGDELEVAMLMRELKERRVKAIVGEIVRDFGSLEERMMFGIQGAVDRAESERTKERMGRGKRERALKGLKNCGPATYGYRNPLKGTPGRGTLVIIPDEADVVRRIFELCVEGKGDQAIAKAITSSGVPAPRGGTWGKSTVRRILQNPAYIGTHASNIWRSEKRQRTFRRDIHNPNAILVRNAHPPIIDEALWDASTHRPRLPRTANPRMLTGLLRVNGESFGGDSNKGVAYYRGPRGKRGCPWLVADETDTAVWNAFVSLATSPEFVGELIRRAQNPRQQQMAVQELAWVTEQIAKLERKRNTLVEMRSDNEITKDEFATRSRENAESIRSLQAEQVQLRAKAAVIDGTFAHRVVKALQTLLAGRTRLTTAQRRGILTSIVRRIDVVAVASKKPQARDPRGRVQAGSIVKWAVESVSFQLSLPAEPKPSRLARGGVLAGLDVGGRVGRLDTNPNDCAPVADADGGELPDIRVGHKGTIPECCASPPPR